jgi:AcrR family transcriptional regulator
MSMNRANRPRRHAKQDRSRATVETILEAAARVLAEQGYAAATTNRVAEVAGVSIGTLYEYFANREEVFEALIRQEIDGLVEALSGEDLDPDLPVIPKLGQLIARGMERMRYGPVLFRALEHAPEGALAAQLAPAREQVIGFVRLILEAHRSELRVPDLDLAAFVTVSAVEGIAAAATNERFDDRLRQEIEDLLRAYLTGQTGAPS